jgi:hypothetical protein
MELTLGEEDSSIVPMWRYCTLSVAFDAGSRLHLQGDDSVVTQAVARQFSMDPTIPILCR